MRKRTELEELVGEHALLRAELQEAERRAKDAPALRVPSSPGEDELRPPRASKREHEESVARRVKQRTRGASASHAPVVESDEEQPSAQPPVDYRELGAEDTVQCPICQHAFTTVALNEHLDRGCTPGRASPPRAPSGRMDAWLGVRAPQEELREAKRLTRPQYQLKSERDMRKMLEVRDPMCRRCSPAQSLGLSSTGNKDRLVERHRQWVNLFNANLDAAPAHRESLRSLRRQLSAWERSQDDAAAQAKMPASQKHYRQWLVRLDLCRALAYIRRVETNSSTRSSRQWHAHRLPGPPGPRKRPVTPHRRQRRLPPLIPPGLRSV